MGFKSVVNSNYCSGILPYVKFKWNQNFQARGYLSTAVRVGMSTRIHIEIDEAGGMIRIKPAKPDTIRDSVALGSGRARGFAMAKKALSLMGTEERIYLQLRDDGWYYGNYKEPNEYLLLTHG